MKKIGNITKLHGFKGELVLADLPVHLDSIKNDSEIFIGFSESFNQKYILESFKNQGKKAIIQIKGINSPQSAQTIVEKALFCREEDIVESNDFTLEDLAEDEGFTAIDVDSKEVIGKVVDIWETEAHDILVIKTENGEMPVPYVEEFVKKVDEKKNKIFIKVIPGFDEIAKNEHSRNEHSKDEKNDQEL